MTKPCAECRSSGGYVKVPCNHLLLLSLFFRPETLQLSWAHFGLDAEIMAIDYSQPVLVVNDLASMTEIISSLLKKIGFTNIDDAADGADALAKMQQQKYSLVISDWKMEPMNGHELLDAIRAIPPIAGTPFIMVTAHVDATSVISARRSGVDAYITVPFTLATLKSKVVETLDR
jgi:two-component system, chemotaxis family, chemotaxis protein CheY